MELILVDLVPYMRGVSIRIKPTSVNKSERSAGKGTRVQMNLWFVLEPTSSSGLFSSVANNFLDLLQPV